MSIAEKLTTIAENEKKVYDKGADDANTRFWNGFTDNRNRLTYTKAFQYTDFSGMTIPNGLVLSNEMVCQSMFINYNGTTLPMGIDMSNVNLNATKTQMASYRMFQGNEFLKYVHDMNLPAMDYYNFAFAFCYELETIEMIRSNQASDFSNAFEECYKLKNITFDGVIGTDLNFINSPLSKESVYNIILHLADYSESGGSLDDHIITLSEETTQEVIDDLYNNGAVAPNGQPWDEYTYDKGWNFA